MKNLRQGESAMEAVAKAIVVLEDDPITNAGYGSNLTINCTVECDASMMDGKNGNFGAVGAVSGIKNPILAAQKMAQQTELLPLGRIPPMLLTGSGAKAWAEEQGLQTVDDGALLTEEALATYGKHMQLLRSEVDDTVGAIAIDVHGNVAAGVSSGGISLKFPVKAAMYGSGCWAQNGTGDQPAIACSTSGTGEQIMRTRITTHCAEQLLQHDDIPSTISRVLRKDFLESPYLRMYNDKSVGMITLRAVKSADGNVEFCYAHVTESMGIGCMSGTSKKPKTLVSRKLACEAMKSSGWLVQ
ncbi:nucleophile aminohydrolase [Fennellomyces sp. T-0311]|nr:nucleophile aminohydrolase [Fennellomyces sp. T-0311]